MPPLSNARQDDYDDPEDDFAYFDSLGEEPDPLRMWAWAILLSSVAWIVVIAWEISR